MHNFKTFRHIFIIFDINNLIVHFTKNSRKFIPNIMSLHGADAIMMSLKTALSPCLDKKSISSA